MPSIKPAFSRPKNVRLLQNACFSVSPAFSDIAADIRREARRRMPVLLFLPSINYSMLPGLFITVTRYFHCHTPQM